MEHIHAPIYLYTFWTVYYTDRVKWSNWTRRRLYANKPIEIRLGSEYINSEKKKNVSYIRKENRTYYREKDRHIKVLREWMKKNENNTQ